jgi:hypothetical protein
MKRVEFRSSAKQSKKAQRVRKDLKRQGIVGSDQRVAASNKKACPLPLSFCMNVKRKELQKLQLVSD